MLTSLAKTDLAKLRSKLLEKEPYHAKILFLAFNTNEDTEVSEVAA